jgi:AcrR family transcriptional regulator
MADTAAIEREVDARAADGKRAAERIHDAAKELFYRQGIRATGIEGGCSAGFRSC